MPSGAEQSSFGDLTGIFGLVSSALDYITDRAQRSVLFWDVMHQRGNQYRAHLAENIPHLLHYASEPIMDGASLEHPVNFFLVRIIPPPGFDVDPALRPFVFIDPRAGHGPGIGGFKPESEIGAALKFGYPCYFIGFRPHPMPGQTIEDVAWAEVIFLEKIIAMHPEAESKPCVVGNCQAGWAVMMLAAMRPELFGPIILAGSPLSYWTGVKGQPMRYGGGLVGGSWLAAFLSDLGHGKFDGAWLVQNFETLNPSNTLWNKQYKLYANIDTEASRYLGFERWWGGHINLNAEEIQFIVDELFIGNRLAAGLIQSSEGVAIDLRNISSPIIVFCSDGDNITPPQQALGWILDLYDDVDDIKSHGQTIIYAVHATVGHLGIFVSSAVAQKEHHKFSSNITLIDSLHPGLFEAKFVAKDEETANPDLVTGEWVMHLEHRTLDDIRALGGNDAEDDRRFATAARVSKANLQLYRTFLQRWVRSIVTARFAEWMCCLHPLRLQYELLSDANPFMAPLAALAREVRQHRHLATAGNPFVAIEAAGSEQVVAVLDAWRDMRDQWIESIFSLTYGSPMLQAAVGINPAGTRPFHKAAQSWLHRELVKTHIAEARSRIATGGLTECLLRGLLYIHAATPIYDERAIATYQRMLVNQNVTPSQTFSSLKALLHDQFLLMRIDTEAALVAIPSLLPTDPEQRRKGFAVIQQVVNANEKVSDDMVERMRRVARLFNIDEQAAISSLPNRQ
jgi:pimeloyl-ACP methyl ester carboxylesterase